MSIQLVTYANQTVTPTNDAIIYEKAVDQNGIFYGCNVTVTSNTVNITGGYGLVCGREFVINSESIAVTLAPSGTLEGRLYVRLDLADADAPIQLLTATGNTLPALVQDDDVNYTNGVYEMELATFTVGVSALSDCVETFDTIIGSAIKGYPSSNYITIGNYAICWGYKNIPSIPASPNGSVAVEVNFPITFANVPFVVPFVSAGFGGGRGVVAYADPSLQTTTKGTIRINNIVGSALTSATNGLGWIAIGFIS